MTINTKKKKKKSAENPLNFPVFRYGRYLLFLYKKESELSE